MTEGLRTRERNFEDGKEFEEEGDDKRIGELFQRAELGHPFGYRRDVNLLMDVICDRLSSRLCHRCVRQTSQPICPRLPPSASESCQCQLQSNTDTCDGGLEQTREQITQTLSNRCDSCNAALCPRTSSKVTMSKTSTGHTFLAENRNICEGHIDSDLPIAECRRTRFLKSCSFLEEKFKEGMVEKARSYARKNSEKPVYIKGTNPLLDKFKFELQNDEETKHEFAKLYQENDIPSQLLPFEFETPTKFENRTVGATRHSNATPVDLLRRRFSRNNSRMNSSEYSDFRFDVNPKEQAIDDDNKDGLTFTKRVGNWMKFDRNGKVIWSKIEGVPEVPSKETKEVDPFIHRQLLSLIPKAAMQKGSRQNALIGFADKMSREAETQDIPRKSDRDGTHVPHTSALTFSASIKAEPPEEDLADAKPESSGAVEDRSVQAVPSSYQAQTQTHDIPTRDILTSQQETQTSHTEVMTKPEITCETASCCRMIHADVHTQTSITSQRSNQHLPFSLNTWTQTRTVASKETNSDHRTTTGSLPSKSHFSSADWSTIVDSDSDGVLPLNPRNTVKFYKKSFKKLSKRFTANRAEDSSDSDGDVDHRVGRVLESAQIACPDSWSTLPEFNLTPNKSTHARSFQYSHPVLRDQLSLGEALPSAGNTYEVKTDKIRAPSPPDFLEVHREFDLAAFFELHHLDVPVSLRKKREKNVSRQNKRNGQRQEQIDVQEERSESEKKNSDPIDERLDHVTSKIPLKAPNISVSHLMKDKPEFHQGALHQFDAKEGTRRLSWRDKAPISRKAKFYETEADIAGETKASEEKRKMSATTEAGTKRRISLFEELGLNFWE